MGIRYSETSGWSWTVLPRFLGRKAEAWMKLTLIRIAIPETLCLHFSSFPLVTSTACSVRPFPKNILALPEPIYTCFTVC
jgi:hypothetical protein